MPTKNARRTDPITSHLAARQLNPGTMCHELLAIYARYPGGLTDEMAGSLAGIYTGYWKRTADLRRDGLIEWVPNVTRQSLSGRAAGVSVITAKGRKALQS